MKSLFKPLPMAGVLSVAAALFSSAQAAPLVSPANGVDVFFNGNVNGSYNSNILSGTGGVNKVDDWIITFAPGVEVRYSDKSMISLDVSYMEDFYRYTQHPGLNDNLSHVDALLNYGNANDKFSGNTSFSYDQNYTNNPSIVTAGLGTILRTDVYDSTTGFAYKMDKFDATVGFEFTRSTYLGSSGAGFNSNDSYTVPASFYYNYTDKLAFGLAYAYNQTDVKNAANNAPLTAGRMRQNHTVNFSTRFSDWNKLTGTVNVGVTHNNVEAGNLQPSITTTTVGYGVGLGYAYSDNLTFNLNGNRGFSTGSAGQNIENTGAGLSAIYNFTSNIYLNVNIINYTYSEYLQTTPRRNDNTYNSGFTVGWHPTTYLTLTAGYTYFMNSSNVPNATYNINTVNIGASIHY